MTNLQNDIERAIRDRLVRERDAAWRYLIDLHDHPARGTEHGPTDSDRLDAMRAWIRCVEEIDAHEGRLT